jgi:vancomycin resistance protein VanJ
MSVRRYRKRFAGFVKLLTMAVVVVWITGQILRDRNWWTGLMFYVPTPALVTWLLLLFVCSRTGRRAYAALMILPLISLLTIENHWMRRTLPSPVFAPTASRQDSHSSPVATEYTSQRLIHWNLARGAMGWKKQWQHITNLHPDIIVLSEIPEPFDPSELNGFDVLVIDEMAVACHGPMIRSGPLVTGGALKAYHVTCKLATGPLELMIADMSSNLSLPRNRYLQPFVSLLAERKIDVSVGDFNAPRRSLAFSHLPDGFHHAYDVSGAGWSYTWPVPIPFLAIDQCITGPRVNPVQYTLDSTMLSDHRLQLLEFRIPHSEKLIQIDYDE